MATCKGCGAEIVWIKTPAGKLMPCDPKKVPYWYAAHAKGKVVTKFGGVLSCDFDGPSDQVTGVGYVPHWATCPAADKFRSDA